MPVLPVWDCLMVLLITFGLMASDDKMVSVCQIEKDEESSIGCQVCGTVPLSVWREEDYHEIC
jgi:hypothetical protein